MWCGDVHENVQARVEWLRGGSQVRDSAAARDSSEYIDDCLEPLFRAICARDRPEPTANECCFGPRSTPSRCDCVDWTLAYRARAR